MRPRSHSTPQRVASTLAACGCLAAPLLLAPAATAAAGRLHPATPAVRGETARIERYWTPARMRGTPPLDAAPGEFLTATASFAPIPEPTVPPNAVNGRLFVRQGDKRGYCSGTAINSPSRRLVLTTGHCVNSGPAGLFGRSVWSRYLEFVPAYDAGLAPFGVFIAHRKTAFVLKQWLRTGNPNYDVGALLTSPNAEGQYVADAVGGGVPIATDLSRRQQFQTFGYPGTSRRMEGCNSPYAGDDTLTYRIPGPPTIAIRCRWTPGASGGAWLIDNGTEIDGMTSYGKRGDSHHTYGPYFSHLNVGSLVAGM